MRPLVVLCALAVVGCGGSEKPAATPAPKPAGNGCQKVAQPSPKDVKLAKPHLRLSGSKTYVATVATNCGSFRITLDAKRAPRTGGSFAYLARKRFYDGLTFHRISPGFVIQGGDPRGDGTGGPGYTVVEPPPKDLTYGKGVVAMAKTQTEPAGASGSQFFVVTADGTPLDPVYALVGKVTSGQDVVDRIGALPTDPSTERPRQPVIIRSIRISEG